MHLLCYDSDMFGLPSYFASIDKKVIGHKSYITTVHDYIILHTIDITSVDAGHLGASLSEW